MRWIRHVRKSFQRRQVNILTAAIASQRIYFGNKWTPASLHFCLMMYNVTSYHICSINSCCINVRPKQTTWFWNCNRSPWRNVGVSSMRVISGSFNADDLMARGYFRSSGSFTASGSFTVKCLCNSKWLVWWQENLRRRAPFIASVSVIGSGSCNREWLLCCK